ncbi:hypothetical protein K9N50_07865 [bacterium]|nr:hypothetical protein [bacterium]
MNNSIRKLAVLVSITAVITLTQGGFIMAHEDEGQYLSDKETVDNIYGFIQQGRLDSATAFLKGLGEDKVVITTWINVQCDINNVMKDPMASARIGQAGVDYSLEKGHKLPAAMMLHNISSFFMPNWDVGVDPLALPVILDAAKHQVQLRKEIPQPGPLMWAYWDLGMAELVNGNCEIAIERFNEGIKVAQEQGDKDGEAWCKIFVGKAKIICTPELIDEGQDEMREAATMINEVGQDWEKEEIVKILGSVGLK